MFSFLKKLKRKKELQKDFTYKDYQNPVMEFWEFFGQNSQYTLVRYEYVNDGIRATYSEK